MFISGFYTNWADGVACALFVNYLTLTNEVTSKLEDEKDSADPHLREDIVGVLQVWILPEVGLEGNDGGCPLGHDHNDVQPVQVRLEEPHLNVSSTPLSYILSTTKIHLALTVMVIGNVVNMSDNKLSMKQEGDSWLQYLMANYVGIESVNWERMPERQDGSHRKLSTALLKISNLYF